VKLNWLEDSLLSKSGKPLDTTGYQFEQRKVTKCGIKKRKRAAEDEVVDGDGDDEVKKPKLVKRTRKQKAPNAEGEQLSKDNRVEQAGKCSLFPCIAFGSNSETDKTQAKNSTRRALNSRESWDKVSVESKNPVVPASN
jgi:hypothetical protein